MEVAPRSWSGYTKAELYLVGRLFYTRASTSILATSSQSLCFEYIFMLLLLRPWPLLSKSLLSVFPPFLPKPPLDPYERRKERHYAGHDEERTHCPYSPDQWFDRRNACGTQKTAAEVVQRVALAGRSGKQSIKTVELMLKIDVAVNAMRNCRIRGAARLGPKYRCSSLNRKLGP